MNSFTPWEIVNALIVVSLVAGAAGWVGASARYSNLAWRVSEMEAALVHYWDRIRKRVRVEPNSSPMERSVGAPLSGPEIVALARKNGIWIESGKAQQ